MKTFYNFILVILFLAVYCILSFHMLGFGHGTGLFLAPLMPFGLGLTLYLLIAYLLNKLESSFTRSCFIILVIVSNINTFFWCSYMWNENYDGTIRMWDHSLGVFLFSVFWYLFGQLLLISKLFQELPNSKNIEITDLVN